MKKVIFSTNLPSPYRVDFFNELGKYCDLTVLFERRSSSERNKNWVGNRAEHYEEKYLPLKPVGVDRSKGAALKEYIKNAKFDILIFTNYVSPATIEAIIYCRNHKIQYFIEYDGGFNKKDVFPKSILKRYLLCGAKGHLTTAEEHKKYLLELGVLEPDIFKYPFTSISKSDIEDKPISHEIKLKIRNNLKMTEEYIVLAVGQFIYRKGFDMLISSMKYMPGNIGVYIVGGEPTKEYLNMKDELKLENLHFAGFKTKEELKQYYRSADVFVMPTREDVWGLVVNESMACGLPVVSTNKCIAAQELIIEGINGNIVNIDNDKAISDAVIKLMLSDYRKTSENCLLRMQEYTIECMVAIHKKYLKL